MSDEIVLDAVMQEIDKFYDYVNVIVKKTARRV